MTTDRAPTESALQDIRTEWVEETTPGEFPTDPSWNAFSDEEVEFTYSADGNKEPRNVTGQLDPTALSRTTESTTATLSYRQARFPVDSNDNVQDPIAYPITHTGDSDYPSLTVVQRRDVAGGGADNNGFREYAVVSGARPVSAAFDGDPSSAEPIPQELGFEAERARTHVIHQPSSSGKLVVKSTDAADTNDVIIETEGASTTETVTLPGSSPNTVETTSSFDGIDAIEVQGDHAGDITVGTTDGASPPGIQTQLTEQPFAGSNTDGVDAIAGVPALGAGSHAATISDTGPLFVDTDSSWKNADPGPQVRSLSLEVEREVARNGQQATRREVIDVGARSVTIDADVGGKYESAVKIKEFFHDDQGDFVYTFDSGETITAKNVEIVDAPDFTRSAGDTNYIPSASFVPTGDPAITISKS